jgi:uncharacterized protein (DUF2225 family)
MTTIATIEFDCPCCGEHFETTTCTSTNNLGPTTTDLFAMAAGEQPIHHQVHTCPHCGFSCQDMEEGILDDEVKNFVAEVITPQLPDGPVPSWQKFTFVAQIDESVGADHYSLGMLYLHAAWCCYDLEHEKHEASCRLKAIEHLTLLMGDEELDDELKYVVPYLIAEQFRRIDDPESARQWYETVTKMTDEHPDRDLFVALAMQQMTDPKDTMGEVMHQ